MEGDLQCTLNPLSCAVQSIEYRVRPVGIEKKEMCYLSLLIGVYFSICVACCVKNDYVRYEVRPYQYDFKMYTLYVGLLLTPSCKKNGVLPYFRPFLVLISITLVTVSSDIISTKQIYK